MYIYICIYIYIIVLYYIYIYIYIYIILYIVLCYIYIYIYYLFTYLCILMHTYAAHSATMVLQSVVHNLIRLCIAKCCVENAQVAAQGVLIHFLRLCQNWVQVQLPVSLHQTYTFACKLDVKLALNPQINSRGPIHSRGPGADGHHARHREVQNGPAFGNLQRGLRSVHGGARACFVVGQATN